METSRYGKLKKFYEYKKNLVAKGGIDSVTLHKNRAAFSIFNDSIRDTILFPYINLPNGTLSQTVGAFTAGTGSQTVTIMASAPLNVGLTNPYSISFLVTTFGVASGNYLIIGTCSADLANITSATTVTFSQLSDTNGCAFFAIPPSGAVQYYANGNNTQAGSTYSANDTYTLSVLNTSVGNNYNSGLNLYYNQQSASQSIYTTFASQTISTSQYVFFGYITNNTTANTATTVKIVQTPINLPIVIPPITTTSTTISIQTGITMPNGTLTQTFVSPSLGNNAYNVFGYTTLQGATITYPFKFSFVISAATSSGGINVGFLCGFTSTANLNGNVNPTSTTYNAYGNVAWLLLPQPISPFISNSVGVGALYTGTQTDTYTIRILSATSGVDFNAQSQSPNTYIHSSSNIPLGSNYLYIGVFNQTGGISSINATFTSVPSPSTLPLP